MKVLEKRNPIILIHGLWNNSSIFSSISSKLDDIGIEVPSAAIKEISVFDAEGSGKIVFDASEINHDNLSYVVFFDDLLQALQESEHSKIIFDNEIINTALPHIAANIPAVNNVPNRSALSITPIPSSDTPKPSPLALR